jgi:TolB protein
MPDFESRFRALAHTRAPELWPDIRRREPRPLPSEAPLGPRLVAVVVAFIVATAAIGLTVRAFFGGETPRPAGTAQGAIVFVMHEGGPASGRNSIVRMSPDGSGRTGLTSGAPPSFDGSPAWSEDGELIAFSRDFGIYVMDANGGNATRLGAEGSDPTWSADGARIAFQCGEAICLVNLDSGEVSQLTDPLPAHDSGPAWSPNGKLIAFTRTSVEPGSEEFRVQLYVMRPDGTGATSIANVLGHTEPAWSPDGRKIAFAGRVDEHDRSWEILVMNADGTGLTQLTYDDAIDGDPAWSPDGTRIVFSRRVGDGDSDIYVMNADGSGMTRLTSDPADEFAPVWQPLPVETTFGPTPSQSPTPTMSAAVSDAIPIESSPGYVSAVTYGFGSVWISSYNESQEGWITRLDLASGEKLARISTGDVFPTWEIGGGGLTVGNGSLWLAGAAAAPGEVGGVHAFLLRVDPDTSAIVARIDLGTGSGADVAVDPNGVWALSFSVADNGTTRMLVTRVDPSSNAVIATIPLDATYGHYIFAVQGSIVVQTNAVHNDTVAGTVLNIIDPAMNTIERSVALGSYAWPAAAEAGLWALDGRTIKSIDPATGEVLDTWEISNTGDAAAVGEGGVWFLDPSHRAAVHRFDPATGLVDVSVKLDRDSTPIAIAVARRSVWVLNYEGTVTRVALS